MSVCSYSSSPSSARMFFTAICQLDQTDTHMNSEVLSARNGKQNSKVTFQLGCGECRQICRLGGKILLKGTATPNFVHLVACL